MKPVITAYPSYAFVYIHQASHSQYVVTLSVNPSVRPMSNLSTRYRRKYGPRSKRMKRSTFGVIVGSSVGRISENGRG